MPKEDKGDNAYIFWEKLLCIIVQYLSHLN